MLKPFGKLAPLALALILAVAVSWGGQASAQDYQRDEWNQWFNQPPQAAQDRPWHVSAVRFQGFKHVTPDQAEAVMETKAASAISLAGPVPFDPLKVARDEHRLVELFYQEGYFSAKVDAHLARNEATHGVTVTFRAEEGKTCQVRSIEMLWARPASRIAWELKARELLWIKVGQDFSLKEYERSKATIRRFFDDNAHPRTKIAGQVRVYREESAVDVALAIDIGPRYLFGETTVRGNEDMSPGYILTKTTYVRGQPFSLAEMEKTQKALLDTGFFSTATLVPEYDQTTGDQVPIAMEVRERDMHSIQLGVGYGTEENFRARLVEVNRNMFGWNEMLTFEGKVSSLYQGLVGTLHVPYILNRHSTLVVRGGLEQIDNEAYVNRRPFLRPAVEFKLAGDWSWYLAYNVEWDQVFELKTTVPDPDYQKQTFFISSVPVGLKYDNRNSLLNPTEGTYASLEVEVSPTALGSELDFVRPMAQISHIIPLERLLRPNWYLALRAKAGMTIPLPDNEEVPMIRRFFPGGADSVRGYPYQKLGPLDSGGRPLGGESMVLGSVEVRYPIWGELGGVVFLDMGNAYPNYEPDLGSLRFTTGLGLRYDTPVGPLRVDWGYQLNPPDAPISRWEYYLSVGQAF